jgi:Carboxypeptidase regulatory-like domain
MLPRNLALLVARFVLVLFPIALFVLELTTLPAVAAQLAASAAGYPVRGTVVNSITGEAIRGALVQIYSNRQRSVLTGGDGTFQFADVPAGTVNLNVQKPGFFTLQAIQSPRAQAAFAISGPDQAPVVVKLVPEGVISGHISGDGGEPVESFPMQLLVERVENGRRTRAMFRGGQTNDEGEFRIAELSPGKYFVFLGPSFQPEWVFPQSSQQGARGYPAAFYPGVSDIGAANPVEVAAGQHVELNVDLASQPFHRISGTVSGYVQNAGVNFQVTNATGQQMPAGFRFDQRSGTFQTVWLPAGTYTLTAEMQEPDGRRTYFASQGVNLTSDLTGIHLHLLPNLSIPVRFRVEQTRSDSSAPDVQIFVSGGRAQGLQRLQGMPSPARVELTPQNEAFSQQRRFSQAEEKDSSIEIPNVPPGVYSVQIFPTGPYYVESARSGSLNLLEQNLTVAPGSAVEPIAIVLRDDFASLEGSVALGAENASAMVIAIPEGGQQQIRNVDIVRPSASFDALRSGAVFEMPQLAPGTYKVLAVDRADDFEYGNPEVLQKYASKGREISLLPNQQAKIELELVHIGD